MFRTFSSAIRGSKTREMNLFLVQSRVSLTVEPRWFDTSVTRRSNSWFISQSDSFVTFEFDLSNQRDSDSKSITCKGVKPAGCITSICERQTTIGSTANNLLRRVLWRHSNCSFLVHDLAAAKLADPWKWRGGVPICFGWFFDHFHRGLCATDCAVVDRSRRTGVLHKYTHTDTNTRNRQMESKQFAQNYKTKQNLWKRFAEVHHPRNSEQTDGRNLTYMWHF